MEDTLMKRELPHSIEAEQSVIGSMLLEKDAILTASELLAPEDFYQQKYAVVYSTIMELFQSGMPTDLVTLQDALKRKDVPPEISSIEFLRDLLNSVPTSANIRYYAEIVAEKALLRRMIKTMEGVANNCYLQKDKTAEIMDQAEKEIFTLLQKRSGGDYVPIRDVVVNVINNVEAAGKSSSNVTGVPTGFIDLDYYTSGLQPSDLILLAARPAMGKTAFVLNLADNFAVRKNYTTAIFSLEMSKEQLVTRMLSMESHVESSKLRSGNLSDNDWDNVVESSGVLAASHLIIDDTPGITVGELRSKCRKYKLEHDLKVIIIDYLQLMAGSGRGSESRQQEISEISRSLKALARELNVPIIALSQLSRACETRPDHRPMLSDLRESGAIEQDADIVMFIYRDEYYHKDSDRKGVTEIIIAKQRNGAIGTVELAWIPELTKFANIEH